MTLKKTDCLSMKKLYRGGRGEEVEKLTHTLLFYAVITLSSAAAIDVHYPYLL